MRLRHIEVFHAIMQVGTISDAAQVLHMSQAAVSKVLQYADQQRGMPLFERVRGKLYPRPETRRLFIGTEKLHRDLHGIRRLAAGLKSQALETIRLMSPPTIAPGLQRRAWAPAIAVQRYLLTASAAPLSHGAGALADCIGVAARGRPAGGAV